MRLLNAVSMNVLSLHNRERKPWRWLLMQLHLQASSFGSDVGSQASKAGSKAQNATSQAAGKVGVTGVLTQLCISSHSFYSAGAAALCRDLIGLPEVVHVQGDALSSLQTKPALAQCVLQISIQ